MAATAPRSQERPSEGRHFVRHFSRSSQALSELKEHPRQKGFGKGLSQFGRRGKEGIGCRVSKEGQESSLCGAV